MEETGKSWKTVRMWELEMGVGKTKVVI